jgi:hypothetical protein
MRLLFILLLLFSSNTVTSVTFNNNKTKDFIELKMNKYGFMYRSKTNTVKLSTNNSNCLKNINLSSSNCKIVKRNDSIYEVTDLPDISKNESINVLFYDSKLKKQRQLYSFSFPILEEKEMRAFIDEPKLIIHNIINYNSILKNRKIKILQNDSILDSISVISFCLTFYEYYDFLELPDGTSPFKRYCSQGFLITEDMIEGIYGLNFGQLIYIESITASDKKGNIIPLPPIVVEKGYFIPDYFLFSVE